LIRSEALIQQKFDSQVKAGRQSLVSAGKDVKKEVETLILGGQPGMEMVALLREVQSHPDVEQEVRREAEIKEFEFYKKLMDILP
jgi:superkiller protein 3